MLLNQYKYFNKIQLKVKECFAISFEKGNSYKINKKQKRFLLEMTLKKFKKNNKEKKQRHIELVIEILEL